jgi:hypothetical protein
MLSTSTATLSTSTSTSTRADINPAQRILTTGDERQSPSPSPLSCSQTSPAQSHSPQSVPICVHPWLKNQHPPQQEHHRFQAESNDEPICRSAVGSPLSTPVLERFEHEYRGAEYDEKLSGVRKRCHHSPFTIVVSSETTTDIHPAPVHRDCQT